MRNVRYDARIELVIDSWRGSRYLRSIETKLWMSTDAEFGRSRRNSAATFWKSLWWLSCSVIKSGVKYRQVSAALTREVISMSLKMQSHESTEIQAFDQKNSLQRNQRRILEKYVEIWPLPSCCQYSSSHFPHPLIWTFSGTKHISFSVEHLPTLRWAQLSAVTAKKTKCG